jgi:hypothetical protein
VTVPMRAVARPRLTTYLVGGLPGTAGWPICPCWIICIRCWYICCNCWLIVCWFITAGGGTGKVGGILVCSGCPNVGGTDRSGWVDKDDVEESGCGEGEGADGSGGVGPLGELTPATVFSGCTGAGGSGGAGSSCLGGGAAALE